jgi:ubiquinone biosynthesis protein
MANDPKPTKKWCRDNGIQPQKLSRRMAQGDLAPFLLGRLSLGLRPGNVMMLRKNRIALIDFGSLGLLDEASPCLGKSL